MQQMPGSPAVVYAGLAILGLLILIFGDWISALVYALVVVGLALVEWRLGRWNWFENRRRRRATDRVTLEAYERRPASGESPRLDQGSPGAIGPIAGGGDGGGGGAGG